MTTLKRPDFLPDEVYLEFITIGAQVKVTAIDAQSGVEVAIFGPITTPQADLERLALRKLRKKLTQD